jgi:hypothetical protein
LPVSTFAFLQQQNIPTYFGNQIAFSSFLRKLQRWGFNRRTSRIDESYEFCSPTFKRIDDAMNETGIDGGGACITNPAITNDFPSLESFTVSAAQLGLPTFADAAAAAAPPIPLREKKPRRAGFRDEFLHRVRIIQKNTATHAYLDSTLTIFVRLNNTLSVTTAQSHAGQRKPK